MSDKRDERENYLLGLGYAFEDATKRIENSCGPVNMVISCDLVLEMVSLIENSEEFKNLGGSCK